MILGFEVKQLCLGFDIIYDRRFEKKKKRITFKRETAFYPCLMAKEC